MTGFRVRALTVGSAVLLSGGIVAFGVATLQIREMDASVGRVVLPPLVPRVDLQNPVSAQMASLGETTKAKRVKLGTTLGSIWLPSLDERWAVIEGTRRSDLRIGVGHVVQTALPGALSNAVLAGHRETVFSRLGELVVGNRVVVRTNAGRFTYRVTGTRIVKSNAIGVLAATATARLTLITCYPFVHYGPSPQRYIVTAKLVSVELPAKSAAS
jgi:sortase A